MRYFVVQPYGRDKGRESTVLYETEAIDDAFAEIRRIRAQARRTGGNPDVLELLVVDEERRIVRS